MIYVSWHSVVIVGNRLTFSRTKNKTRKCKKRKGKKESEKYNYIEKIDYRANTLTYRRKGERERWEEKHWMHTELCWEQPVNRSPTIRLCWRLRLLRSESFSSKTEMSPPNLKFRVFSTLLARLPISYPTPSFKLDSTPGAVTVSSFQLHSLRPPSVCCIASLLPSQFQLPSFPWVFAFIFILFYWVMGAGLNLNFLFLFAELKSIQHKDDFSELDWLSLI